ncbi:hypothetical protein DTO166G4_5989 [Paecilomyces variotii]|uniref:DUF7603 domain-containing protein n=1 Tax=Byssochlamys spectabilis TaxID=264951 RepID=A0A443HV93_BYSSP|nr:hypothetical protein C8Q69DRAFT_444564 [Paecilomyces variotii]KAJ9212358.1 hypothetical protein DTO166G4_5989 [Paecilomyces variotii]KAJ9241197.1 hypothetical protein DTO166G5_1359 [Paecilomyces variotii]KAJ9270096.1 hypothetical protein DTO212C5_3835 [Paecilomyces variotii]KAJ9291157.1 hypothetical protein DTO021C3_1373 [Paecilomyces variotii]KAJ9324589.1 hypothetical protein DTO027B3_4339 [Paecilomyces variotii]
MEGGISPPSAAPDGLSSLRRQEDLSIDFHIPEPLGAQTTPPPATSPPVHRKPLPGNASPVVLQEPIDSTPSSPYPDRLSREQSASSRAAPPALDDLGILLDDSVPYLPRDLDRFPRKSEFIPYPIDTSLVVEDEEGYQLANGTPIHSRLSSEPFIPVLKSPPQNHKRADTTMALHPLTKKPPPLRVDSGARSMSGSSSDAKQPKTPGNKITSFFGWKTASSPGDESAGTDDSGRSPVPSQMVTSYPNGTKAVPTAIDVTKANGLQTPTRMGSIGSAMSGDPDLTLKVNQLEAELREISTELAGSIRREMDLEDLVDRLQSEIGTDSNRRTSDYFSDSGAGSVKYGPDSGGRPEDIERIRRAAEQERAQLKVELSQKWQEERSRRAAFESHVQLLESQVQQFRRERVDASNLASRTKELELALEDTRRKLAEERQLKDNFEDLLTAMRVELEQHRNERDQLKDEAIPQLQARLRDSAGAAPDEEVSRLRQELEALRAENATLAQSRFSSIAEEDGDIPRRGSLIGLTRSSSLARRPAKPTGSLSRSNSVSGKDRESRDSLADRVKDVEAQRDALHQALKSLLERQAYQTRESEKRIRMLEIELERAQECGTPRRLGYEREVRTLREEINLLRQRADEALEQKWQCEKGLGGLKMDLDRAEQETHSLRVLLQEHDIAVPEYLAGSREELADVQATSSSLEAAYQQLQADREYAEANAPASLEEEQKLAEQLAASVERTEALASQVRQQLETNNRMRNRLAEAISRGEREQKLSAARINDMQQKLKALEDTVLQAQQQSEEEVAKHEEDIKLLKDNHNAQLLRAKNGIRTPVLLSPKPPSSPFFDGRSPRLDRTTAGEGMALSQAVKTEALEARVKELEKALRDADMEMEEVVGRMNKAQIEVAELQFDRENALRETRRLQAEIMAEREKFQALRG